MDWKDIERLRTPGFALERRGYDRREVDKFLNQLVDWLESDAANEIGQAAVQRKLELVGKSTSHILLTTEQECEDMRRRTQEECAELRAQAEAAAQQTRRAADEYGKKVRDKADADARKTAQDAAAKAAATVEEGDRRRAQIEGVIQELQAHREATLGDLERLRGELGTVIGGHRSGEARTKRDGAQERPRAAARTAAEPAAKR
jgi:DivIVA domain-containing protein